MTLSSLSDLDPQPEEDSSPGAGVADLALGNATTKFNQFHLSIPNAATTRKAILDAVIAAAPQEVSS